MTTINATRSGRAADRRRAARPDAWRPRARTAARLLTLGVLLAATTTLLAVTQTASAVPTPVYNAPPGGGVITEVLEKFGPFELDAYGGLHDQDEGEGLVPRPAGAFGLKYALFDLVDENDQPIGRHDVHLHHFVIGTLDQTDPACPDRNYNGVKAAPLIGTGMERTPIAFNDPYAVPVGATDSWGAVWHLMNMSNTPRTVYVTYKLGIQTGANDSNTRWLMPFWTDARTCPAGATWNVPGNGGPGSFEERTKEWAAPFDGFVVGIGGHLHDGGVSITTKHEDGTVMCENLATYYQGMLDAISTCPIHDSVKAGEKLAVTSRYDNSAAHADVMGMSVMFLWNGNQGTPPTSNVSGNSSTTTTAGGGGSGSNTTVPVASSVVAAPRFTG